MSVYERRCVRCDGARSYALPGRPRDFVRCPGCEGHGRVPYRLSDFGDAPYMRSVLVDVIIYHQRTADSRCACGWGDRPEHLGASWAEHLADVYEASIPESLT